MSNKPLFEYYFEATKEYDNPFFDVKLDVKIIHTLSNKEWLIPAFWMGKNKWCMRFFTPLEGEYTAYSICNHKKDSGLHEVKFSFVALASSLNHKAYRHGKLVVKQKEFVYEDATHFFWFGDTWWMALSERLDKDAFATLLHDRVTKNFSVIQLVAGLFPDMDSFDIRSKNSCGFAWKEGYETINPAYFDGADKRIEAIVDTGIVPCIVGAWGYYLTKMGKEKMQHHWRYLVARYSAYPVIWCVAGETSMPWYLSSTKTQEQMLLKEKWSEITAYIKQIDPYNHLLTTHPIHIASHEIINNSLLDFEMLQLGHGEKESIRSSITTLKQLHSKENKPIVVDEINYEGILGKNNNTIQRASFWISILCGANGFSYGANGIWQVNQKNKPFGNSPSGDNWGNTPWDEAMQLRGSYELGKSVTFLQKFSWWYLEPAQHLLKQPPSFDVLQKVFCASIFQESFFLYSMNPSALIRLKRLVLCGMQPQTSYFIYFYDPESATLQFYKKIKTNCNGEWKIPRKRFQNDWLLIANLKEISI
jgi:hypothetical protein